MDDLLASLPPVDKVYHVILDNYCTHKHCDEWLKAHPNVVFHYTPTSASWLNMIEIWNNIFSRKVLKGASFEDLKAPTTAMTLTHLFGVRGKSRVVSLKIHW